MVKSVRGYVMYGLGGPLFSSGMDVLAAKLETAGVLVDDVYDWSKWRNIVEDIEKCVDGTKFIVCGHSMGGNASTWIAEATKRRISLLATYDPTIWSSISPLGANVDKAINFRGTNWFNIFGHSNLYIGPEFSGKLTTIPTAVLHHMIDDDSGLHAQVLNAVKTIVG